MNFKMCGGLFSFCFLHETVFGNGQVAITHNVAFTNVLKLWRIKVKIMTMERKERIEKVLNKWRWDEENQTYLSLTAFENQINLMNSFREQYYNRGDLSDKQIDIAEKIIKQNEEFSRMWRLSRVMG